MQLTINAISRVRSGPERELMDDYAQRLLATGRQVSLGPLAENEIDNRSLKTKSDETRALVEKIPTGAAVCILDERGKTLSSRDIARQLASWRDDGRREACFLIGGADGLDHAELPQVDLKLAFGPAVWPHKLVRVMLVEQLYRAASILAGSPYHRD